MSSIRSSTDKSEELGIDAVKFKLYALLLSAFFAGLAGGIYAHYMLYIYPHDVFNVEFSLDPVVYTVLGGLGTVWGPVLGTIIFRFVAEVFIGGPYVTPDFHRAYTDLGVVH